MPQFTQSQLDTFWQQYVGMSAEQVLIATTPGTDGYLGPTWSEMLNYVLVNRLYGFADYNRVVAGSNQFPNRTLNFIGPTRS